MVEMIPVPARPFGCGCWRFRDIEFAGLVDRDPVGSEQGFVPASVSRETRLPWPLPPRVMIPLVSTFGH